MEVRVTVAGRAVPEPRRDQPVGPDPVDAAVAGSGVPGVLLDVAERYRYGGLVGVHDLSGDTGVGESPQDADGFGGTERQIPTRDGTARAVVQTVAGGRIDTQQHRP